MLHVVTKYSGDIASCIQDHERTAAQVGEVLDNMAPKGRPVRGGLTLVPGGGTGGRGREFRELGYDEKVADSLGRLATVANGMALSAQLTHYGVPSVMLTTPSMRLVDINGVGELGRATPEEIRKVHFSGAAAIVLGGSGKNNVTTDTAAATIANLFKYAYHDTESVIIKTTEYDGVYNEDPRQVDDPNVLKRYSSISALTMIADYDRFRAVDRECLVAICESGIPVRVFSDKQHTMQDAIGASTTKPGTPVGTLIVPEPDVAELYA